MAPAYFHITNITLQYISLRSCIRENASLYSDKAYLWVIRLFRSNLLSCMALTASYQSFSLLPKLLFQVPDRVSSLRRIFQ